MPIHAEGEYTTTDVWRGTRLVGRVTLLVTSIGGIILLGMAVLLSLTGKQSISENLAWFGIATFFIVYPRAMMFYRARRLLSHSPTWQGRVRFDFDEEGFTYRGEHVWSEVKWAAVIKWKEGKTFFLLYQSPRSASLVPKRFFSEPASIDALRGLLSMCDVLPRGGPIGR
jgi:YcxB-like protein